MPSHLTFKCFCTQYKDQGGGSGSAHFLSFSKAMAITNAWVIIISALISVCFSKHNSWDLSYTYRHDFWSYQLEISKVCHSYCCCFLLQGHVSVLTLIPVSVPPRCCAVACKISQSFCQKCRWQVTTKHTCTLPMLLWMKWHSKLVHSCMVYTELVSRWQQFYVAPSR